MMNTELMFSSKDQTWTTPDDLFYMLNLEFKFTLDPCCYPESAKCDYYFTPEVDGLKQSWAGHTVFMNPPYDNCYGWIEKAYMESTYNGATVACLIPARTDTKYWHDYCMKASEIRLFKGRIKFGVGVNSAPFPSALVIFRPGQNLPFLSTMPANIKLENPVWINPVVVV